MAFEIAHALRHKNKAADALANAAMDRGMGRESSAGGGAAECGGRAAGDWSRAAGWSRATGSKGRAASGRSGGEQQAGGDAARICPSDGAVHLLGAGRGLPDGIFVKIIPE